MACALVGAGLPRHLGIELFEPLPGSFDVGFDHRIFALEEAEQPSSFACKLILKLSEARLLNRQLFSRGVALPRNLLRSSLMRADAACCRVKFVEQLYEPSRRVSLRIDPGQGFQ